MSNEKLYVHAWEDVVIFADNKKRLAMFYFTEKVKSGKQIFEISGRAGWFSRSDHEIDMDIAPSDIKNFKSYGKAITIFLINKNFSHIEIRFKSEKIKNKCYNLVANYVQNYREELIVLRKMKAKYRMGDLSDISPYDFEKLIGELYEKLGYKLTLVGSTGDEGIDLYGTNLTTRQVVAIQCKRYIKPIGSPELRNFIGAMATNRYGASKGIFVTTSRYTQEAQLAAKRANIDLIDGKYLSELLKKYY